jgi:hypothetical protein
MNGSEYVDPEMLVDLHSKMGEAIGPPAKLPQGIHSMDDIRALGNPKTTIRYEVDPHFCMGVIEGEIKDCELAVGGAIPMIAKPPRIAASSACLPCHLCRRFHRNPPAGWNSRNA